MPDQPPPLDDVPQGLRDIRTHALTVRCPRHRCRADVGQPCINPRTGGSLTIQAAHDERIRLADEHAARAFWCDPDAGGCDAPIGAPCRAHPPFATRNLPVHVCRLRVAGVWRAAVPRHQLLGFPRRRDPDAKLAAGIAERDRYARERATEQAADRAAQLSRTGQPEPPDLDHLPEPEPEPDDDEPTPDWVRGPGATR